MIDSSRVAMELVAYACTNLLAEGLFLDAQTPIAQVGLDSFCIVELLLFAEGAFGVRVPETALTHENLVSLDALARCIAMLADTTAPARDVR